MISIKKIGLLFTTLGFLACGGESDVSDIENPLAELDNVLETLNDDLSEIEGVHEIYSITNGIAGDFELGDAIHKNSGDYLIEEKKVVTETEEGPYEETVFEVSKGELRLLDLREYYDYEVEAYSAEIGEMLILSDLFETSKGIGPKSTITEFTRAYPDYSIWYTYLSDMYVIDSETIDAQFLLDGAGFNGQLTGASHREELSVGDFDPETKITVVRMYKV